VEIEVGYVTTVGGRLGQRFGRGWNGLWSKYFRSGIVFGDDITGALRELIDEEEAVNTQHSCYIVDLIYNPPLHLYDTSSSSKMQYIHGDVGEIHTSGIDMGRGLYKKSKLHPVISFVTPLYVIHSPVVLRVTRRLLTHPCPCQPYVPSFPIPCFETPQEIISPRITQKDESIRFRKLETKKLQCWYRNNAYSILSNTVPPCHFAQRKKS